MTIASENPLVSIVIPCFNAEQYVAEAIQSALDQTYPHVEVIVIDDGSTDQSVSVLKSFGSAIRWETGPNRGACAARNRGLQLAQGEFIQFLDADDWLYPTKLERQVSALIAPPSSTPVCDGEVIESGQVIAKYTAPASCEDSLIPLLNGPLPTPAPLHRRDSLLKVGGFREELPCSQERDLHLRLACHGWPLKRIAQPLYGVRRVPGSVSSSLVKVLEQHLSVALGLRDLLKQKQAWTDKNSEALACFLTRDGRRLFRLGRTEKAAQYFETALEFHASGGWSEAYGRLTRLAVGIVGPMNLERILEKLRMLRPSQTVSGT